jgi:Mg2+ and Co2+ transporter CorA
MDLRELQGWRLRTLNSQQKVSSVIQKLKSYSSEEIYFRTNPLLGYYEVVSSNIQSARARLENIPPVVTSLVQIIDMRQSFAETANISRLTILALIFVPLTVMSSLFSMEAKNLPGFVHFWVSFVVAIPVTVLVYFEPRPTTAIMRRVSAWLLNVRVAKRIRCT